MRLCGLIVWPGRRIRQKAIVFGMQFHVWQNPPFRFSMKFPPSFSFSITPSNFQGAVDARKGASIADTALFGRDKPNAACGCGTKDSVAAIVVKGWVPFDGRSSPFPGGSVGRWLSAHGTKFPGLSGRSASCANRYPEQSPDQGLVCFLKSWGSNWPKGIPYGGRNFVEAAEVIGVPGRPVG